jgi:hypothetical protein
VIDTARQSGDDVVLSLSAGSSVRLENMRVADLDIGDFVF